MQVPYYFVCDCGAKMFAPTGSNTCPRCQAVLSTRVQLEPSSLSRWRPNPFFPALPEESCFTLPRDSLQDNGSDD